MHVCYSTDNVFIICIVFFFNHAALDYLPSDCTKHACRSQEIMNLYLIIFGMVKILITRFFKTLTSGIYIGQAQTSPHHEMLLLFCCQVMDHYLFSIHLAFLCLRLKAKPTSCRSNRTVPLSDALHLNLIIQETYWTSNKNNFSLQLDQWREKQFGAITISSYLGNSILSTNCKPST